MKYKIKHRAFGRLRIEIDALRLSFEQADILEYYLLDQRFIRRARVHENTAVAIIEYTGDEERLLKALDGFRYENVKLPEGYLTNSQRSLNCEYRDKLIGSIFWRFVHLVFLPAPLRAFFCVIRAIPYIAKGVKKLFSGKLEVEVLDATAITVSLLRGDFSTASSVMFMLRIGGMLEEWTHKKSIDDLAKSMAVSVGNVWLKRDGGDVLVPVSDVEIDDVITVRMGSVIPFDGVVVEGESEVNQSSFTGEALPVNKSVGDSVFAGTVVEDGEISVRVKSTVGSSRYDRIVRMIEETEKLKSESSSRAEHLADKLVPFTLAGTALVWLLSRNVTKALSVLMVDFSCALKLAMPIAVLSAMKEAGNHNISVKGGKFLEAVARADTIVFDKTGTLTKASPEFAGIVSFSETRSDEELLRIAACMEEHFPHSMARAVVRAAEERELSHEEMHTKVEYIVAHGITTTINKKRAVIGSYHFVFEDEGCKIPRGKKRRFNALKTEYSHLYLAIEGKLEAVLYIEDPLREEAADAIEELRKVGIERVVMMTGDSERTAASIAKKVGVDEYYSEVLPEDKADFVKRLKENGHGVIMVGDGVNDSPALSAADAGIAISDGASIAREIADITISADDLFEIAFLKRLAGALDDRINGNYRFIVGFNSALIVLGILGVITPATSALLHNGSTLLVGLKSMGDLIEENTVKTYEV